MAGKFELGRQGGDWRFNLKASNGQVIATSQGYASKASALNGIDSVKEQRAGRRGRRPGEPSARRG